MPKKTGTGSESIAPAKLLVPKANAVVQLQDRLTKADQLLTRLQQVRSRSELEEIRQERYTWNDYNKELLSRIFDTPQYADEYSRGGVQMFTMNPSPQEEIREEIDRLNSQRRRIQSILERFSLIEEAGVTAAKIEGRRMGNNVFVVHGHDDTLKLEVARFIELLHLKAIILAEQANQGRTIIEKFEAHAEAVDFAVVLLTPDDTGGPKGGEAKPRARQNVILELGYFIGRLGRKGVCALYKSGVELPSDILGVVYVAADADWRLKLAKEMKVAGLPVDLNLVV